MGCCKSKPKPKTYIDVITSVYDDDTTKVVIMDDDIILPAPIVEIVPPKQIPPPISEFQQQLLEKQQQYKAERAEIKRVERQKLEAYFELLVKHLQNERKVGRG